VEIDLQTPNGRANFSSQIFLEKVYSVNSISFIWNDNMREKREANANAT
jgi:hypothetical protein